MDCSLPGSSAHGIFQTRNTGVGCHALLQEIFPTQGSNPALSHCRQILYRLSHQGGYKECPWFHPANGRKTRRFSSKLEEESWVHSCSSQSGHPPRPGCRIPAGWTVLRSLAPTLTGAALLPSRHSDIGSGKGPACSPQIHGPQEGRPCAVSPGRRVCFS